MAGDVMGTWAVLAGGILPGSLVLGTIIAVGVIFVISGMISAGAAAINDAKKGTCTQLRARFRRAAFSAVTFGVVSKPVLFGAERLINRLSHKEMETWKNFLRNYDLATVICYGIAHIPNRCMTLIVKLCAIGRVSAQRIAENAVINSKALENADFFRAGDYIENQAIWKTVRFGSSTMAYSGCEIMAVYNALHALGKEMTVQEMVELISIFERNGAVLQGKWGCSSYAITAYFLERGYKTAFTCSRDMDRIDAIAKDCETVIVTVYNNRYDIRNMIHTVSVTKDKDGNYTMHNAYKRNQKGEYVAYAGDGHIESLQKAIRLMSYDGQASPICVIGISNLDIS